jgi:hypothetical protein
MGKWGKFVFQNRFATIFPFRMFDLQRSQAISPAGLQRESPVSSKNRRPSLNADRTSSRSSFAQDGCASPRIQANRDRA